MTDLPERIWIVGDSMNDWGASMEWRGAAQNAWDTEYIRADYALALVAEAYEVCAAFADEDCRVCTWDAKREGNDITLCLRASYGANIARGIALKIRDKVPSDALAAREARDKQVRDEAFRDAAECKYQRDCLGLNNEGDPIGGDPPQGWKPRAEAAEGQLDAEKKALREKLRAAQEENRWAYIDAAMEDRDALSPAPVSVDPLEVAELQSRLAQLEADNAAETTWGAAVGVRYAEIKAIRKRLRALSHD